MDYRHEGTLAVGGSDVAPNKGCCDAFNERPVVRTTSLRLPPCNDRSGVLCSVSVTGRSLLGLAHLIEKWQGDGRTGQSGLSSRARARAGESSTD